MAYHIRLEQFEGPLNLLLSLIEKEKLDVTQVSLAKVADQYLQYLRQEKNISLANLSSFLMIAARLILIKSRALLPVLEFSDEENESMEDLEVRLREYQRFREASEVLGRLFERHHVAKSRESFLGVRVTFYPSKGLTVSELHQHFVDVLGDIPVMEALPEQVLHQIISLEEMIVSLQKTLAERVETSFAELTRGALYRHEVIVSFLAVLEMVKQRIVCVNQERFFSDIFIQHS
ncbi:MAG: segregation and condensation protein A [Minisyncoccota bacterium]